MLVLSRKEGEVIIIGDDIRVTVAEIRGNHVRLGFTAPPGVAIRREELPRKAENIGASAVRPAAAEAER
jgi:carbon storage regulator